MLPCCLDATLCIIKPPLAHCRETLLPVPCVGAWQLPSPSWALSLSRKRLSAMQGVR